MQLDTLQLKVRSVVYDGDCEYTFYDYIVSGKSLFDLLEVNSYYKVGILYPKYNDMIWHEQHNHTINQLLGKIPSEFMDNRHKLFECPTCDYLECGVYTTDIVFDDDVVIWQNLCFGIQDPNQDARFSEIYKGLTFRFNRKQYESIFNEIYMLNVSYDDCENN